ncbi:DUF2381 family protein [Pyxidicoccus sp. 3LG]
MPNPRSRRSVLAFVLMASVAVAREHEDKVVIRTLELSEHPRDSTHNIYVSGQVATVLRFEQDVDATRTRLLGWEGRFTPLLVGSRKVVIEPLRDLGTDEGVPLLVTLADGTEIPLLVRPPWSKTDGGWTPFTDQQVNVFKDLESYNAVVSALHDARKREDALREQNERLMKEENSVDHAYATLLANGESKKTPFSRKAVIRPKDGDMEIVVELFSGPAKAAAVVTLTNIHHDGPWGFDRAYLTRDLSRDTTRPFALRMDRATIVPGQTGTIAVIADKSAFETEEGQLTDLALQIFRGDGLMQLMVTMEHTLIRK